MEISLDNTGLFVTVRAGMTYWHLFSREEQKFFNVYNQQISCLRSWTLFKRE